jgi:DNA helicase-4
MGAFVRVCSGMARHASDLDARVLSKLNPAAIGDEAMTRLKPMMEFARDPKKARNEAIVSFVDRQ